MREEKVKFIISKTITFVLIFIFILLFKGIFGVENTLIGVTTITGALLFLERNLARKPFKYLFELIGVNVALGFLAYLAGINFILGFVCNFIAMFSIGYIFSYEVRANMYVPFGLQYVFMLAVPVELSGMSNRILSLIFGAMFIMVLQVLFNKDMLRKSGNRDLKKLIVLASKMLREKNDKKLKSLSSNFEKVSVGLKETIYNSRKEEFYIESNGKAILDIILFLKDMVSRKKENEKNEEKIIILKEIEEFLSGNREVNILLENDYIDNNVDMKVICRLLKKLKSSRQDVDKKDRIQITNRTKELKKHLNKNSMKFRYAIKLGLSIGIVGSLIQYFNIFQGKWILFTIFALIQPYKEQGRVKARQRLEGSLLGGGIALILFTLVKNPIIQSLMVMFVGYLDSYHKTYKEKMIYVTISAVGSSLILGGTFKMVGARIILIVVGILISTIFNEFILPYSVEDAKRDLVKMYRENGQRMIEQIEKENKEGLLENHYVIGSLIEKKLNEFNFSNTIVESKRELLSRYYKFKKDSTRVKA